MIEIERQKGSPVVRGRFRGDLSKCDLTTFVASLQELRDCEKRIRVLLDWTAIEKWEADTAHSSLSSIWRDLPHNIDRAAIVHEHCWDRQAAVLGAMMRINQTVVRSWLPSNGIAAMEWLRGDGN